MGAGTVGARCTGTRRRSRQLDPVDSGQCCTLVELCSISVHRRAPALDQKTGSSVCEGTATMGVGAVGEVDTGADAARRQLRAR